MACSVLVSTEVIPMSEIDCNFKMILERERVKLYTVSYGSLKSALSSFFLLKLINCF
jgi:hypothetical protein